MSPILFLFVSLVALYYLRFAYKFVRNYLYALRSGFKRLVIPWEQNGLIWMISSVGLRPWLRRQLPPWLFRRVDATIYGFEFHNKLDLYRSTLGDGDALSYIMVTAGSFEVNTRDPEMIAEILKRPMDFQSHPLTHLFMNKFGKNVITSDGEDWARQRKVIAATINEKISRTVFEESIKQTNGMLDEVMRDGGETNRLFDMMKKITINVLSGAGMGKSVSWNDESGQDKVKPGFKMNYIDAVKVVIEAVGGPIIFPRWLLNNYPSSLPGAKFLRSLSCAIDEFPVHTNDLLEKEKGRGGETRSNIMSQLLRASEQGGKAHLSDEEMMGNLFIFTAAGFETTANTLSFSLILLCRHPEWQQWLFEEIDSIMPSAGSSEELDYAAIFPRANRCLAFMLETLRLFPSVIHLTRQNHTAQIITTPSNGKTYWIPPKSTIYTNNVAVHLAPVWRNINLQPNEESSDTDEFAFRPTRWINASSEGQPIFQPPRGCFIPWSFGPRVCPGQKMAQVEFVSIFLSLLRGHAVEAVALRGGEETREEMNKRLDDRLTNSISMLTLQMPGVCDRTEGDNQGVKLRLRKR